jgi:hypothetical protein
VQKIVIIRGFIKKIMPILLEYCVWPVLQE